MSLFINYTLNGLTEGMIFAALALALVLIYRATRIINFAQGAMGMMTTFIALSLLDQGLSYWWAFVAVLAIGFVMGAIVERVLIRPLAGKSELNPVIVTIGLLVVLEGIAGAVYGNSSRGFPAAYSQKRPRCRSHADCLLTIRPFHLGRSPAVDGRDARAVPGDDARSSDAGVGLRPRDLPVARGARRHPSHARLGARRGGGRVGRSFDGTDELLRAVLHGPRSHLRVHGFGDRGARESGRRPDRRTGHGAVHLLRRWLSRIRSRAARRVGVVDGHAHGAAGGDLRPARREAGLK